MSGICAVAYRLGVSVTPPPETPLNAMLTALLPYGPDSVGSYSDASLAVGRCLLRVLPEDNYDEQPIFGRRRRFCLVADARLDNRSELISKLALSDSPALSDSFILACAWECWEESCLNHLLGAFAFISVDLDTREIFAARDRAGEYSLCFHRGDGFVAVASTPGALLAIPEVPRRLNEERIADWLLYSSKDRHATFFEGIERIPAGHYLRANDDAVVTTEYWHPHKGRDIHYKRDRDYSDALSDLIDRATACRLRTRGGVASQLSAGLDSGSVTASAASLLQREGKDLTAYTYIPQPGFIQDHGAWLADEGPAAAEVAAFYSNIRHVKISTQSLDLLGTLHSMNALLDEPVRNLSNGVWYLAMLRHARENDLGTILQGALGNSTISFSSAQPLTLWFRQGRWAQLFRIISQGRANGEISVTRSMKIALQGLYPQGLDRNLQREKAEYNLDFLAINPEFANKYDLVDRWRKQNFDLPWNTDEQRMSLEKSDFAPAQMVAKALTHVDLRDPTADSRIWDFCLSIPLDQYIAGGRSRSLIRRAMHDRLPASTVNRRRAGLQGSDWYLTMGPFVTELRRMLDWIEQSPAACRILDVKELKRRADNFPGTRLQEMSTNEYWHVGLLQGITLGTFLRTYDPEAPPPGDWYAEIQASRV